MPAKDTVATVISRLRYRDAPAAINWLQRAFVGHLWNFGTYDPWQEPQA